MHARFVVVLVLACGERQHEPARELQSSIAGDAAVTDGAPADAGTFAWQREVGPPPPLDQVRPRMKQADVQKLLVEAGLRRLDTPPPGFTSLGLYETAVPGVLAGFSYRDRRLELIELQAVDNEPLLAVLSHWPKPESFVDLRYVERREWPPSASGWRATLHTKPAKRKSQDVATLAFRAAGTADDNAVDAGPALFPELAKLIGAPLDDAQRAFGAALRRETADDEDVAAEAGEARQGFARLRVPWSTQPWELVLHTDAGSRIRRAVLTGSTKDEGGRVALFSALRGVFGEPRPVVTAAGRVAIALATPRVHVLCAEDNGNWTITITGR